MYIFKLSNELEGRRGKSVSRRETRGRYEEGWGAYVYSNTTHCHDINVNRAVGKHGTYEIGGGRKDMISS